LFVAIQISQVGGRHPDQDNIDKGRCSEVLHTDESNTNDGDSCWKFVQGEGCSWILPSVLWPGLSWLFVGLKRYWYWAK